MKQKIVTFIFAFLFFGALFGVLNYYTETKRDLTKAVGMGVYFGIAMALFEVFLQPRIKNYFSKNNKK